MVVDYWVYRSSQISKNDFSHVNAPLSPLAKGKKMVEKRKKTI